MPASFNFQRNRKKLTIFGIFNSILSTQKVNLARFARNVEWDVFCNFQTLCIRHKVPCSLLSINFFLQNTVMYCVFHIYSHLFLEWKNSAVIPVFRTSQSSCFYDVLMKICASHTLTVFVNYHKKSHSTLRVKQDTFTLTPR